MLVETISARQGTAEVFELACTISILVCRVFGGGQCREEASAWSRSSAFSRDTMSQCQSVMQHRPRGQARSSSSSFAAPGRVLSNATWGRLELPCKRCRWRTKRRADGCPDRGMHDPGHEVVPSGCRRLSLAGAGEGALALFCDQAGRWPTRWQERDQQGDKAVGGTA